MVSVVLRNIPAGSDEANPVHLFDPIVLGDPEPVFQVIRGEVGTPNDTPEPPPELNLDYGTTDNPTGTALDFGTTDNPTGPAMDLDTSNPA